MNKNSTMKAVVLVVIALVSLSNLFGISAAGLSVILGVIGLFVFKRVEKLSFDDVGLGSRSIKSIRRPIVGLLMVMPTIMNFLVIFLSKFILPDYVDHVVSRSEGMLSVSVLPLLMLQLAVFALGEEIAWRAFFQKQLQKFLPFALTLVASSILFALGHLTSGNLMIVIYDLVFVFVNSLFYGMIFQKTNSIWLSACAHFIANTFAVIILFFL